MIRPLPTLALLALLASPVLAQEKAPVAPVTNIESIRKNPDDTLALNAFLATRYRAIMASIRTNPDAATKKIAELRSEIATIQPTKDASRNLLDRARLVLTGFEKQVQVARIPLAELEARLKAKPDDADALLGYQSKVVQEISANVYSDSAAAEKQIAAAKTLLTGVKDKAGDATKKRVDATLKSLAGYERIVNAEKSRTALVGKPAAPLDVETWVNGSPVTDADLKGKVVLIDFWAVWCGPCVATFPHLREWNAKYASKGLVMIGLTRYYNYEWDQKTNKAVRATSGKVPVDKEQAMLAKFAAANELTHRIGVQKNGTMMDYYGVTGIPEVVVIDREGKVRMIRVGSGDANAKAIGDLLEKLLGSSTAARGL